MTEDEFRKSALALPGVIESAHHNHPDFRVKGKIFATLSFPDDCWGMVNLTPDQQRSFMKRAPRVFKPCNGAWGRRGATNIHLSAANERIIRAALNEAFNNIVGPGSG